MVSRRQLAVLFVAVGLMAAVSRVEGEVFTAIVEMEKLLKAEYAVAQDLKQYVLKEEARLAKLKSIADDYEQHSATALGNVEHYLGNPVNAFLLVKRFTTDWEHIVNTYIRTNYTDDVLAAIASKTALFPEQTDLEGAVAALLRLQDTYALPTSKIANGELATDVVSPIMSSVDCFEIGRLAYLSKDYYHTILWMEQSLHALQREDATSQSRMANPTDILDYLAYAMYMQGNIQHALNLTIKWLKYEPDHERAQRNKMYYEQMLRQEEAVMGNVAQQNQAPPPLKNERPRDAYRSSPEFHAYERLCRGEEIRPNPHARKLTCRYVRHHPIFYLSPAKEETVYLEPWIVIYHDVLTEREIVKIKELAIPRLNRATARNVQTGRYEAADYRISKSAWLKDDEDLLINRVTLKTVAMTNLTTTTVEELQVVNYGIGGHYEPHYDFARSHERNAFDEWRGNRIATVIFYMSDVAAGGATVFPDLGVKLWPEKGACAIWFNLLKNGDGDLRTRHAACPVLTGSKWVCNKWYHERGQEFARPCSTDPNE